MDRLLFDGQVVVWWADYILVDRLLFGGQVEVWWQVLVWWQVVVWWTGSSLIGRL